MKKRICGWVNVEGDSLFYKVTGNGEPLLLIPGGGGDGDLYLPLADSLCDKFKVITYDRRSNGRSTINNPLHFDIAEQSRDALAVLNAAFEKCAYVFGNSSGAVIALHMATSFPSSIKKCVVHEAPIAKLHPDKEKWLNFFDECYKKSFKFGGSSMASTKFLFGIETPSLQMIKAQISAIKYLKDEPKEQGEVRIPSKITNEFFIKQELIPITNYEPNFKKLKTINNKITIAAGQWSLNKNIWLYEVSKNLAKEIGSDFVTLPGHHGSFMDNPKKWAKSLEEIFI